MCLTNLFFFLIILKSCKFEYRPYKVVHEVNKDDLCSRWSATDSFTAAHWGIQIKVFYAQHASTNRVAAKKCVVCECWLEKTHLQENYRIFLDSLWT